MAPHSSTLPGKSHGWRSLVGCSPWGHKESDRTERLHFRFSLSCIGEGNGNPLQCSCLESPRDGGAWWAAVHGVAQSRTRLKRLNNNNNNNYRKVVSFTMKIKTRLYKWYYLRLHVWHMAHGGGWWPARERRRAPRAPGPTPTAAALPPRTACGEPARAADSGKREAHFIIIINV